MAVKDVANVGQNSNKIITGIKGLFMAAATAYVISIPVHDIWTGESMVSKTWNTVAVGNLEDTKLCTENENIENSFICQPRGDGKGLETLVPDFLKK